MSHVRKDQVFREILTTNGSGPEINARHSIVTPVPEDPIRTAADTSKGPFEICALNIDAARDEPIDVFKLCARLHI